MSRWVRVLCVVGVGLVLAARAHAQAVGDPDQARFRFRSFSFSPALRITDLGWDSNVFNDPDAAGRRGDTTVALSPLLQGWFRSPRVRASLRGQWDYYYFQRLTSLRALDTDQSGRVEMTLNRLTPFVSGSLVTTRHRQLLEIDAIAERRYDDLLAGAYVRLTAKTSVGVYGGRSDVRFETGALFRDVDLARSLNHIGTRSGIGVRYAVTPLTTFNVDVLRGRDRFEFLQARNAESFWVTPSVEFKPFALISGRAAYGFRQVTFSDSTQPIFKSTVASVDLQYRFATARSSLWA